MTVYAPVYAATLTILAAGSPHGGEGAGSPFAGDVGSAFWTLLVFILVVIILGKYAWGPILKGLQKREDFIHDSLEQAKKDREEAETRLRDYEQKLGGAQAEASKIIGESRREAEDLKRSIEEAAKNEAAAMIERAKREIGLATDTAVKELYDLSGKLATDIASRIIRKEVDVREHERLISESIEELGRVARKNGTR